MSTPMRITRYPSAFKPGRSNRMAWLVCANLLMGSALIAAMFFAQTAQAQSGSPFATSPTDMVATVHPLATQAGQQVLADGGNAIDAAIAAALTLSVVDGFNSGIGGGCFILIRTSDGELIAIDGREKAPAAAHRDMYLVDGQANGQLSRTGPLAIGVPGAVKAYHEAANRYGKLQWSRLVQPAIQAAEKGFVIDRNYQSRLRSTAESLAKFPASKKVLLDEQGNAWPVGHRLRQTDLARTMQHLAERGPDWFYEGAFAERLAEWMEANGGLITADDMKNYSTVQRTPIRTRYREYEIAGFPPPSSGGVHVAQILNILEQFDISKMWNRDPNQVRHVVTEAMKLAFADRAHWLGDPDFAKVPRGLIDPKYGEELAKRISLERASPVESYGHPPAKDADWFERHTTHVTAADSAGNWIAMTTTVNTTFGSKVMIPGTGVIMNNQMDDFSIAPGVANAYGLVGSEANSVQAGKRPLSSMSPTIILRDGQPVMTVGAAGGPRIITQVLLAIIRKIDLGMPIADAVGELRWHHQWSPDRLYVERGTPSDVIDALAARGHRVTLSNSAGVCQAIAWDAKQRLFTGVHDPRVPGAAGGSDSIRDEGNERKKVLLEDVIDLWEEVPGALGNESKDRPTLTVKVPSNCNGTAIVILPGGGYGHLAMGHEGREIADWLDSLGIASCICDYRHRGKGYGHPAPLQDAQRAIQLVRANAADWGIDPARVGVIGFSAGGHLAASVSNHVVTNDQGISSRPDFAILCYPVILFGHESAHGGSQRNLIGKDPDPELVKHYSMEQQVTANTPPTFLWHTVEDQGVKIENSLEYFTALRAHSIPAALHAFPRGRHGLGLAKNQPHARHWPKLCAEWLGELELLPK